jgi:hypothetical protein
MNIPKKSPTLQAQTDGNITDKKPADQDIARRNARIQAIRRPAVSNSTIPLSNTPSVAAAEPTEPLQKAKPDSGTTGNTNKAKPVVKKPNAGTVKRPEAATAPVKPKRLSRRQMDDTPAGPRKDARGLNVNSATRPTVSSSRVRKRTPIGQNQKNLGEMLTNFIREKLDEGHSFAVKSGRKGRLVPSHRYSKESQHLSGGGKRYRIKINPLTTEEAEAETKQPKKIKRKKGTPVVFDPETTNLTY